MGATDEEHLAVALSQGRVIFTQDDDFLRLHHAQFNHAGIIYCQQQKRSIGEIIRGLILVWEWLEPEDMSSHVEFL
jgi:predicted nuclease of predicted toxin-antitoxin system